MLVTGSSGFLAQHVMPELQNNGYKVIGVDKRPLPGWCPDKFIQTSIEDLGFRDLMGIDYVIHLGWRTNIPDCQRYPEESTKDNIQMTLHLLQKCKEAGVKKFLFPSTASLYGNNSTPWKEDMPPNPIEPYSWQKLACESLCKMYSEQYGLPTVVTRFFQIFGEHQREDTSLAIFIRMKKEGKKVTLTETTAQSTFKSGQRQFLYAGDLARAVRFVLESGENGKGEIYNVTRETVNSMEEIALALDVEVEWISKRSYEVERHEGSCEKIKNLGWIPKVEVINWLKNQI